MPVERLDMSEQNDIQRRKAFALGVESLEVVGTVVHLYKGFPVLYHLFVGHVGDILHTLFLAEQIAERFRFLLLRPFPSRLSQSVCK